MTAGAEPARTLVRLEHVSKTYRRGAESVRALEDVTLTLGGGKLVGLFGNNGAGKTTLLRMLTGLVAPSSGSIEVLGRDVSTATPSIGWCSAEDRSFYPHLSGRENLRFYAALRGLDRAAADARIAKLAASLALDAALDRASKSYSAGERQRLNVIRAVLHEPDVLLLDEPLRSLDPPARRRLVALLESYARPAHRLVLWTGHEFQGLEDACDELLVLHSGRLVLAGDAEEVLRRGVEPSFEIEFEHVPARDRALRALPELAPGDADDRARARSTGHAWPAFLLHYLGSRDAGVVRIEHRRAATVPELLQRTIGEEIAVPAAREPAPDAAGATASIEARPQRGGLGAITRAVAAVARRDRLEYLSHRFDIALNVGLLAIWTLVLYFVSQLFDARPEDGWIEGDYYTYALVGLAYLRVAQVTVARLGSAVREEQLLGTLEPALATGRSPIALVLASLAWPLATEMLGIAALVLVGGFFFGADVTHANLPSLAFATGVMLLALASFGLFSAAFVIAFRRGDPIVLGLNLLTLLVSGVFFPTAMVPAWLRPLSEVLPLTHGLAAARAAIQHGAGFESPPYARAIAALVALTAVALPLSVLAWRAGMAYARRAGTLAQA